MATLTGTFRTHNLRRMARELENARQYSDSPFSWEWEERRDLYGRWQSFYDNSIYDRQTDGGFREVILRELWGIECSGDDIISSDVIGPYFNPIKPIVDAYDNVLRGAFGREIKVAPQFNGKDVTPQLKDPAGNPIGRVWRWSNLDTAKDTLQRYAAGLGACGIRIVADSGDDPSASRVTLQFDHPGRIKDFDTNSRGDITAVLLEYTVLAGPLGTDRYDVEVVEQLDKDTFKTTYNSNVVREVPNPFGFCPYVILKHGSRGEWGVPAFHGSEVPIHLINRLRAYIARGVPEVVDATWFATAGGPKPESFKLGRSNLAYVRTDPDSPNPTLEPLVAPLNLAEAAAYAVELEDRVKQRQPEMLISDVKLLSGLSGETIAKVLKPAEAEILKARASYEHALIRALQMALSEMIVIGLFDAGTGMRNSQAADRAYQSGALDFEFEARAALPMTPFDAINQAKADTSKQGADFTNAKAAQGIGVDDETVLKLAGFNPAEIKTIRANKAGQDSVPTDPL